MSRLPPTDESKKKGSCTHLHGHNHAAEISFNASTNRSFFLATSANIIFVILEFFYGVVADSSALIADAGHNLFDVLSLLLAWGASILSKYQPTEKYTYGLGSSSILAALANACFLLIVCGGIGWEAFHRILQPAPINGWLVSGVAFVGIIVNGCSALLFLSGRQRDLNIRGAYLHMIGDAAISLGVAVSGIVIAMTQWFLFDPLVCFVILIFIIGSSWQLLINAMGLAMKAVPAHVDCTGIVAYLKTLPGVKDIYDLHVWAMSTTRNALTVYLIMPGGFPGDTFMAEIHQTLEEKFSIHHSTIEVQISDIRHQPLH